MKEIKKYIEKVEDGEIVLYDNPEYIKYKVEKLYEVYLKKSGIPQYYWNINFEDYVGDKNSKAFKMLYNYANNILDKKYDFVNLYIQGSSGTQKCLVGDTLILTDLGFSYIKDFSENIRGFTPYQTKILTKEGIKTTSHFFEEDVKETIKIQLQKSLEIEGTPEHPIFVLNPDLTASFKKLSDIEEGDYVILQKNTAIFNRTPFKIDFKFIENKHSSNAKILKNIPSHVDSNISRMLGYYVANGHIGGNSITISSKNDKIKKDLDNILSNYGLSLSSSKDIICNRICSIYLKNLLHYLLGVDNDDDNTARFKFVPKCILQGTKENQIDFLRALIDCDGYFNIKQNRLGYFTASPRLAKEVYLMLLNLGLFPRMYRDFDKKYQYTYYEIWLHTEEVEKYFNLIKYSLKYTYVFKKSSKPLSYNIPYIKKYTTEQVGFFRKLLGVKTNGMFLWEGKNLWFKMRGLNYGKESNKMNLTVEGLQKNYKKICSFLKYDKDDILLDLKNKYEFFTNHPNYVFIPVFKKEYVLENKKVYDFHIPEYHNFYSNGIISHNTAIGINILKSAMKQGLRAKFILAGQLINKLMKLQSYNVDDRIQEEVNLIRDADIILIDDIFDSEKSLYWKGENNSLIISEWDTFFRDMIAQGKKIILTSNFSLEIIQQKYGDYLYELIHRNFKEIELRDSVKEKRKLTVEGAFDDK